MDGELERSHGRSFVVEGNGGGGTRDWIRLYAQNGKHTHPRLADVGCIDAGKDGRQRRSRVIHVPRGLCE